MAHHAYLVVGSPEQGQATTRYFAETELGLMGVDNPDVTVFSYELFSVADARRIAAFATQAPVGGDKKCIGIYAGRLFHEAQNALLKLFEEPTPGTTLILSVPTDGVLLPTLRSRLVRLHAKVEPAVLESHPFITASKTEREKFIIKLIARSKSDKDEEKQAARREAAALLAAITQAAYHARVSASGAARTSLDALLADLNRFSSLVYDRSAPLKLIFEHLLLVVPASFKK